MPLFANRSETLPLVLVYFCVIVGIVMVILCHPDMDMSSLLTMSLYISVVAIIVLTVSIKQRRSVAGLSLKMIHMQRMSSTARLMSTLWMNGYVPMDSTGNGLYQFLDVLIVIFCSIIIYSSSYGPLRETYEAHRDTFPLNRAMLICLVVGSIAHPNLNHHHLFDTLWMTSLNLDSLASLPQVWMMTRKAISSNQPPLTTHYVFTLFLSRVMSMIFWLIGYVELRSTGFIPAGKLILLTHFISLVLVADFVRQYFIAMADWSKTLHAFATSIV
eukprot:GEMP01059944.1.p1 GENE.GEMP01059944.1~~GEMP01059944.1.p1  ORF type:complete len:273 (+),score=26.49 GEMP01059944.1:306-1124(+)